MNKRHAIIISLAAGAAAIAGTVAATQTIHLGRSATPAKASDAAFARRTAALDRTEIALRKALNQKPPKLPPLPTAAPTGGAAGGTAAAPARQAQRVIYVRPAPIIRHVPRPGGEHESGDAGEHEGGGGDGGGGFDD